MTKLIATNIEKNFTLDNNELQILKGVNLELEAGQIVALRGASGSGKSTLLNILGTLDQPSKGEVLFDGTNVNEFTDEDLSMFRNRNIGFVFQFHHLLPELTVWENLELPVRLSNSIGKAQRQFLENLLELTGLVERRTHFPSQLSGGERQRVAVIRALANMPGIVFADEPTGNLDSENGEVIMGLIKELREQHGQTFLIATHSSSVAASADHTLLLESGLVKLVEQGSGQ